MFGGFMLQILYLSLLYSSIFGLQIAFSLSKENCANLHKCIKEVRDSLLFWSISLQFRNLSFVEHAFFMEYIEGNTCRLFNMRLELMLNAVGFLLSGYFIFDGAKGLEKLMVRYFFYM